MKRIAALAGALCFVLIAPVSADGDPAAGKAKSTVCSACHGADGNSVNPEWPTLAGQHEDYLEYALNQYRNGKRTDPVMTAQAALVAEEDVALLARYFAGLEGLATTRSE